MKPRAAFFDLDGTLINKPSCERRFFRALWLLDLLGPRQFLAAISFFFLWFWRFGLDTGRKNKAYLSGLEPEAIDAVASYWLRNNLDSMWDREILEQVEICRQAGYQLVLLTGAPEFIAEPIAKRLGMDDCIATRCRIQNDSFTAGPPIVHPLGKAKLDLAEDWCRARNISLADCTAYGDSHQDGHLLGAVATPVAVNPDRRMVRLATANNWQVVNTA